MVNVILFQQFAHYPFGMQIRGSLAKGLLVALILPLLPVVAFSAQKITPGSTCKVLNQKVVYQNKTYTCIKSGKKLVWNKGVAVKNPTPTPTPTPTPVAIPQAGDRCNEIGFQIENTAGYLECRSVSGAEPKKYIQLSRNVQDLAPVTSPSPIEICRIPDARTKKIQNDSIAFPTKPWTVDWSSTGTTKIAMIGIDFPDVVGKGSPVSYTHLTLPTNREV